MIAKFSELFGCSIHAILGKYYEVAFDIWQYNNFTF